MQTLWECQAFHTSWGELKAQTKAYLSNQGWAIVLVLPVASGLQGGAGLGSKTGRMLDVWCPHVVAVCVVWIKG